MKDEPSGEYYDYTKTVKPERPWLVEWHQKYVYRIMHAKRGGTGMESADPVMAAGRPPDHRYVFGDGKIAKLFVTFEEGLEVVRRVHNVTCGVPQIVLLTGWQFEGHDSKYPSWAEVNRHLKRPQDETAVESLRWLIREARKYNCLATLHINMFDAYADSPLFQEYLDKDIIAKDKDGKPIVGNRWSGMDCYHVSYTQEWKHGLAQKRIDDLIAMVPEIQENHCVYVDAFLGARKADQQGPISPYLGHSKEEEGRTQRKIFRYWRDRDIDVASEHVWAMRVDRFVGLQPHSASQADKIEDLPDELYCSNPAHFGFMSETVPEGFQEKFWLSFLPWFYKNSTQGTEDPQTMIDGTDICMPALWCDERTLIAYSKDGYERKTWELPPDWKDVARVSVSRITPEGPEPVGEIPVADGRITLGVGKDEALSICTA
ncbi:MAG: endo-alpha-N-acetylgalactosaminidase family protein [Planctomycetota bacterium]